jgi:hypothetical protein
MHLESLLNCISSNSKNLFKKFEIGQMLGVLMDKPEWTRPLGKRRRRWKDSKMYGKVIGWEGVDWINLAADRASFRLLSVR